jgi:ectoine hydroxylase-related dioxygenase (phytanoyl-CoA dioxygenase family)
MLAEPMAIDDTSPGKVLSDQDVASFRRNGFVLPERGMSAEATERMKEAVERVFRDNADWANLLRMPHVPKRPGLKEGVIGGEEIFKIMFDPVVIQAAADILGPNLIMWGAEIFAKPGAVGKATPWHQDSYNRAIKAGDGGARVDSLMVWIAVDDVAQDNGCLRFIPGSGRTGDGRIEHTQHAETNALLNFEIGTSRFDVTTAVDAVRAPGQFSIHDLYVVHGANANTSGRRRAGLTFHYISSADLYDRSIGAAKGSGLAAPAPLAERPIWLVLGENLNPANDFETGHKGLEDLDDYAAEARRRLSRVIR